MSNRQEALLRGFALTPCVISAKPMSFAPDRIGFAALPCGFGSFPLRFEAERIGFKPPMDVFGSFLCGIESFPRGMQSFLCGNESFPYGNDLQQVLKNQLSGAIPDFSMWDRLVSTWE